MLYLGPQRQFESRATSHKRRVTFNGRVLYADSSAELITALKKIGIEGFKLRAIRENPFRYLLAAGHAWQMIRLRDQGFVEIEEITYSREQELLESRAASPERRGTN